MQMRLLKEEEVERCLSIEEALRVNTAAFIALFQSTSNSNLSNSNSNSNQNVQVCMPERLQIPLPMYSGVTLFKPAMAAMTITSESKGYDQPSPSSPNKIQNQMQSSSQFDVSLGVKLVSVRPHNAERQILTVPAMIVMVDEQTGVVVLCCFGGWEMCCFLQPQILTTFFISGFPSALVAATFLTARRTAAGSAAATQLLSSDNANVLTIFGAGMQAREHIQCILHVRPTIKHVYVVNRTSDRAQHLIKDMAHLFQQVQFHLVLQESKGMVENAVRSAHIICTTTNASSPLFDGQLVTPGTHVNCIGSYQPHMQEIDETLVSRAKIAVDVETAMKEAGDLVIPLQKNIISAENITTIGACLAKVHPLRTHRDDITIFKSVGTAIQDIMTAKSVLNKANQLNAGQLVSLF